MKKLLICLVACTAPATAFAQNEPLSGLIVGAQAGYESRSVDHAVGGTDFSDQASGFVYGGFIGFDLPISNARLGLQAEIADGSGTLRADDGAGTRYSVEPKWAYAVSARAGLMISENSMIYGRVGYAAERNRVLFTGPTILSFPIHRWDEGLLVGGGFEAEMPGSVTPRLEYRYRDLSNKIASHQVLVGLGYRF